MHGTVTRLDVDRLPSGATAKPVWLWWSTGIGDDEHEPDPDPGTIDLLWQTFLRRFDIEHTFRMLKQTLGWTVPKLRDPDAADRWTWLIIAAYTQLRLARTLAVDMRQPWERPAPPQRLTPARVRRAFRHLRATTASPARAPKPARPGPGRPPGRPNQQTAHRHNVHLASGATPQQTAKTKKPASPRPRRKG